MPPQTFSFSDYDCIAFDLDNTLIHYNVDFMAVLEYNLLSKYLIEVKNYNNKHLSKPFDRDFVQKGLILDINRGNILKLRFDCVIDSATHGTRILSEEELKKIYGENLIWDTSREYVNDFIEAWNGNISSKIRSLLDYFDISCSLLFARAVDTFDDRASQQEYSSIWFDILDGLYAMYTADNFLNNTSGYFGTLKANPSLYIKPLESAVVQLLEKLRNSGKLIILITGSALDFADFTSTAAFNSEWTKFFEIIITSARKPGFFFGDKTFTPLKSEEGKFKGKEIYAGGNAADLIEFISNRTGVKEPKILYVGDNVIQDIYAPSYFKICDTLTICEELEIEYGSKVWGCYLYAFNGELSLWGSIIAQHSKLCVPSLKSLSKFDLNYRYPAFSSGDNKRGFFKAI